MDFDELPENAQIIFPDAQLRNQRAWKELPEDSEHVKVAWSCRECGWVTVSDSRERHKMDSCLCGEASLDLEKHYDRTSGPVQYIAQQHAPSTQWVNF